MPKPIHQEQMTAPEIVTTQKISFSDAVSGATVRHVSSEVGPTMVFQKLYQDKPITVIWVFTGGTSQ